MKKNTWKIVIGIIVLVLAGSVIYSQQAAKEANVGISFASHVKGNSDASVTLVEYSDFQCPACAQAYPVVKDILEQYGEQLSFEYKHFPLITIHPFALPAARAAEAAGQQGKFFEMHDKLFEGQSTWSASGNPQAFFIRYASDLGLDVDQFKRHLSASDISDKVMNEFREAQALGLTGTPSFFLNGTKMTFSSYQDFLSQIEAALGVPTEVEVFNDADVAAEAEATPAVQFGF